jgi:hypothetical protein
MKEASELLSSTQVFEAARLRSLLTASNHATPLESKTSVFGIEALGIRKKSTS